MLQVADDLLGDPTLTVVRLEGVDLDDLASRIRRIVCGFPVPVTFNGVPLPRPYAIDALPYSETSIGKVHLQGFHSGQRGVDRLLFLQGLLVNEPTWWPERCDVAHLDPQQFLARLPDRTQLIDSNEQLQRIEAAVRGLWRQVLVRRKAELDGAQFIDRFFDLASLYGHADLFNDIPLLPRQVCDRIVRYPIQAPGEAYLTAHERHIDRNDVERGAVRIACLEEPDEENLAHWMFARSRGIVLVRTYRLDDGHWALPHVRQLEDEAVDVTINAESLRVQFFGRLISPWVVMCRGYSLTLDDERAEVADEALYHEGSLIVPAGESSGDPVRQVSSYLGDDDRMLDEDYTQDKYDFAQFLARLRTDDPAQALMSLLEEVALENYPLLEGRTFRLTVGGGLRRQAVELIVASTNEAKALDPGGVDAQRG